MNIELRLPNINGTDKEQLAQLRSYLYQLVPQLQWALNTLDTSAPSNYVAIQAPRATSSSNTSFNAKVAFDELKPLIIKSAEIVNAYYEEISTMLSGTYVADSDFGAFREETDQRITQSSTSIEQAFANLQQIQTSISNLNFYLAEVNAHIKTGLLCYDGGVPVYGLEIGQENTIDGVTVFNKFARFTADRLSFFDQNDSEIAYVSDYKLYIRNAEITDSYKIGGYIDIVTADGGVITKWVGRG